MTKVTVLTFNSSPKPSHAACYTKQEARQHNFGDMDSTWPCHLQKNGLRRGLYDTDNVCNDDEK